jgi:Ca2+:H+ antiporter
MPIWSWIIPLGAAGAAVAALLMPIGLVLGLVCGVALIGSVIASVHHAEVIAERVGEPYGTVVLSISITVIEVALIVTLMLAGGPAKSTLARDTIFSVIMITGNGLVGLSLLVGALRHREQSFQVVGATASLATLIALTTLTLVLPIFTTSSPGLTYTKSQLIFASVASLVLWVSFVFVQTVRHREYFLPVGNDPGARVHAPPTAALAWASFGVLIVSLAAVVGLADLLAPVIERAVAAAGAPKELLSVIIALLTLLPEGWSAVRAALANRLQISLNLAMGSGLASIGLTIPVVAVCTMIMGVPIVLGLPPKEIALLVLTFVVGSTSVAAGRTHVLQGIVHLVIFGAFLFFAVVP